ncbi:MAG: metal-dependent transcriptional regulator [Algoriphagus sp.]|nr:metal-dependent transcriptional regulator [Algoriphagus sp.]
MASLTEENYLKALFNLEIEKGKITLSDLANQLQVSLPTANSMVKSLKKQDWVHQEKYKPLALTLSGRDLAASIIRKHRLTEMFLVKMMNFGWEEVHEVAEQIEHVHSPKFFQRMDELLGHPTVDPHGSPIPDQNGKLEVAQYSPLTQTTPGQRVKLQGLANSSSEFLAYLNSKELFLGITVEVLSKELFDQSMVVCYPNHPKEVLSEKVAERLLVQSAPEVS